MNKGTGKTTTLSEIVLQLLTLLKSSRIIIVTSSNSAADLLTQRLVESAGLDFSKMLRLVGYKVMRSKNAKSNIPVEIADFCCSAGKLKEFCCNDATSGNDEPQRDWKYIKNFHVVIGTCVTIGDMLQSECLQNYFTHAIVDEAAQCLETETLIPMVLVGRNKGQVILSGDSMQLPPTVISKHAQDRGLSKTLFNRLSERYESWSVQVIT